jgi:uncharacterized protein YdeI (YjbR/CyaY-like superfamily)
MHHRRRRALYHELFSAGPSMPPVVPDKKKIKSFSTIEAFERWVAANHARETEVWLKIYKKDSGVSTVTPAEAPDVALCWGSTFRTLGRQNLFALAFRTNALRTAAGRARKIAALVAMLERRETIVPAPRR